MFEPLPHSEDPLSTPVVGMLQALLIYEKGHCSMTKSLDVISEIVRSARHPFRKADDRPAKAQKHRYERRKIREFIRLSDWAQENPA